MNNSSAFVADVAGASGADPNGGVVPRSGGSSRSDTPDAALWARWMIESAQDIIIAVDLESRIVEFNAAAERCFGYTRGEVLGQPVGMLYAEPPVGWRVRGTARGTRFQGDIRNRRKDGEVFDSRLHAGPIRDDTGRTIGIMGISREITVERRAATDLAARLGAVERENQALRATIARAQEDVQEIAAAVTGLLAAGSGGPDGLCGAARVAAAADRIRQTLQAMETAVSRDG